MTSPVQKLMRNVSNLRYIPSIKEELYKSEKKNVTKLPVYTKEENKKELHKIDLNDLLIKNPNDTFLIRVNGNSMVNAGINSGDLLVVDKSISANNNDVVVASINNEMLVKRYSRVNNSIELKSENESFQNFKINENDDFNIWGVVKSVIRSF